MKLIKSKTNKYLILEQLEKQLKEEEQKLQRQKEEQEKKHISMESRIAKLQDEIEVVREKNKQKSKQRILLLCGLSIIGILINLGIYYMENTENKEKIHQYKEEIEKKEGELDELIKALEQKQE